MRARTIQWLLLGTVVALALGPTSAVAYTPPPVVPWETLLPALPTASSPQPGPVPGCTTPTIACIDYELSRMDALRAQFGCDHRGVFASTYELLTKSLHATLQTNANTFSDPSWVISEDATFANMYFATIDRYARGEPVPEAWQIALDTARSGDANGLQDMLLGINAHVQRDMPYMLASVGLRAADGTSHKPDHDRFNAILNQAYQSVVDTLAARYDPAIDLMSPGFNPLLGLVGNISGDQLVQAWRENVWRNAEALLNARTTGDRAAVEALIEFNAATTARLIAAPQLPLYRPRRDAYCAVHNTPSSLS
ncbi:MAG: DUF5995 family protein [Solirubrobacteraceae bacterium]